MEKTKVQEFHEAHGYFVSVGDWLIFADGAVRENASMGIMKPPPENDYERWKLICKFWEVKLELAIGEFDHKKQTYITAASYALKEPRPGGLPCEQDEAIEELKELKKKVSYCQRKFEQAQAEVEKLTPQNKNLQADIYQQNRERLGNFISALSKIEI